MTVVLRESKETRVRVGIAGRGSDSTISTTEPFLDHMLVAFARYANLSLTIEASGDLKHHLIEDVAITLGAAVAAYAPATCARFGERTIPMDDALVQAVIDIGGRAWYEGKLPSGIYEHFFRSFADNSRSTLHIRVLRGADRHHVVEAAFKATGLALRQALEESGQVFSTKGAVSLRVTE